ncbi:MAG: tetratricopeptide repeat protein, partial [Candidatus Eisenbacteria bacterium]|nr:tetratricopeptide repeat protein [Candidatus Eisenbacteria bacterium]
MAHRWANEGEMAGDERSQKRIEETEKRLRSHPSDRDLLFQLVQLYHDAGRPAQAAALLEARLLEGESDWDLLRECASAFRLAGKPDRALELLTQASSLHAERPDFWSLKGRMHEDLREYDRARADHERALAIEPTGTEFRYRLGVTMMKGGRGDEAIVAFEQCVKQDPRMTKAQINIGYIHDQNGDSERAVLAFQKAIEMNPVSYTHL